MLRKVVAHSARTIPLYRALLQNSGINAIDIQSLEDIARLPVMNKSMFIGKPIDEYIDGTRNHLVHWRMTSGTSGKPLTILSSDAMHDPWHREFRAYRFLWKYGFAKEDPAEMRIANIKIRSKDENNRLFISIADYLSNPEEAIRGLAAFNPDIISSYSSILYDIALRLENPLLPRVKPRFTVSFGEMLLPEGRSYIEKQLSTALYDRYGIEEIGVIAVECNQKNGMHVNSESVFVEILDSNNQPVPENTHGRVIVTDLLNFNMPFIRYDTRDKGMLTTEPCLCGLRSPRLFIEGRYTGHLSFGGRDIHHLEFDGALDSFMNSIIQYQVAKVDARSLEIRCVPGPAFNESVARQAHDSIQTLVGNSVEVRIVTVEQISVTSRGKSLIIVDESI